MLKIRQTVLVRRGSETNGLSSTIILIRHCCDFVKGNAEIGVSFNIQIPND